MSAAAADLEGSLTSSMYRRARSGASGYRLQQHWRLNTSLLVEDINPSSTMLDELRAFMGLKLSIDDFGTENSSLSYLKRFPLDTLKINRTLVRDVTIDPDDAAIVSSTITWRTNYVSR